MTLRRLADSPSWRVVLDNNTWVSSVLLSQSVPAQLVRFLRERAVLLASDETLAELDAVLLRDKFDRYLPLIERLSALQRIRSYVQVIKPVVTVRACRDPKDDKFLSLAKSGAAQTIVTGDEDLLVLNPFEGIEIIRAAICLQR